MHFSAFTAARLIAVFQIRSNGTPGLDYTEGSKSILSYFPLPDTISTPLTILNKFIDAR